MVTVHVNHCSVDHVSFGFNIHVLCRREAGQLVLEFGEAQAK